jgi:phage shock protein PspC (stress-responsive transcriptional regulator)
MNKTIDINLGGRGFTIDEPAYDDVRSYLQDLERAMRGDEGVEEVMADIEIRLAEIFMARLGKGRNVVDGSDVDEAKSMLGEPSDFGANDEPVSSAGGASSGRSDAPRSSDEEQRKARRRLYRDEVDGMVGGVSAGLAAYANIDVVWVRLAWVVLVLLGGAGVPFYLLMWIITPSAITSAERLAMRGESATAENIRKSVEKELAKANQHMRGLERGFENVATRFARWIGRAFSALGRALKALFKFAGMAAGIFLIALVALFVVALVSLLLGGSVGVSGADLGAGLLAPTEILLPTGFSQSTIWFAVGLLALLPAIMLILGVMRVFFKVEFRRSGMRALMISGGFALITGMILTVVIGIRVGIEFTEKSSRMYQTPLNLEDGNPWVLAMHPAGLYTEDAAAMQGSIQLDGLWVVEEDSVRIDQIDIDIRRSNTEPPRVEWEVVAMGANRHTAHLRASHVGYKVQVSNGRIELDDMLSFPRVDRFRGQFINATIVLPDSVELIIEPSAEAFL